MPPSNFRKTQDSEAMKDYRRMLYRLDLATSFTSVEELLRHFMKETLFDGFIEIRVYSVASNPSSPTGTFPTPSTRLSFVRDVMTGEVVADRLFKPAQRPHDPNHLYRQQYRVAKNYPERPPLVDVFRPFIESLLNSNKSTLIFEYRAFLEQPNTPSYDEFDIVTRQMPHKLMVGYIGRSDQGPLAVYQLDENIARTAFLDMNPMSFQPGHPDSDLGRDPTVIENIPNRFQALEGKTIAIDGTLITQRLFYIADPRPHRHVLGWYQLVQELRQNKINIICVFDGRHRVPAKQGELERRRLLRTQAQARGIWEKSRHERLLSLTQALRRLEGLSNEHQLEVLKTLQVDPQSLPLPKDHLLNTGTPGLIDVPLTREDTVDLEQATNTSADKFSGGSPSLRATQLGQTSGYESNSSTGPSPVSKELSTTGGLSRRSEGGAEEKRGRASKLLDDAPHTNGPTLEETIGEDMRQSVSFTKLPFPERIATACPAEDAEEDRVRKLDIQRAPTESSEKELIDRFGASLDIPMTRSPIEDVGTLGSIAEDKLSPHWTEAKLRMDSLKNEDSKVLTHKILDLFDHYNRTTASGPDGSIPALDLATSNQDAPIIPISRVQLKYTQEEAKLWKQLLTASDNATVDLARVVDMVEQFASVELPNDEIPADELAPEEELEPPISERSAKLEEQSGLMAASFERRANPPTALTYAESRLILEAMGIPCIQSSLPYEAEALACSLVLNGLADFVGSEDTDVLMYNAPLLRGMTNRKVPLQIIPSSVETSLGLSRTTFVDVAILMGTDFVKRLPGIGPATAWRLMRQYGSIEVMLEQESRFRPPDVAEYLEQVKVARIIFSNIPPVPPTEDIAPGRWDEQAVYDVMSRFDLQRNLDEGQLITDALSANYYGDDSESKPF